MRCGFSRQNITPLEPAELGGYGPNLGRTWETVHDELWVRAVAIETSAGICVYAQVDATEFGEHMIDHVRGEVRKSLPEEEVPWLLCAPIHTHNAPALLISNMWGEYSNAYAQQVARAITRAAVEAVADMADCTVDYGEEKITEIGFNRTQSGREWDDGLQVVRFNRSEKESIIMFSAAVHPVSIDQRGPLGTAISADWVGYAIDQLERSTDSHALFMMGTSGDVDPVVAWRMFGFEGARLVGALVSERVQRALQVTRPVHGQVAVQTTAANLPLQWPIDESEVQAFIEEQVGKHSSTENEQTWRQFYSEWLKSLQNWQEPSIECNIHILSIGNEFALVSLSGEIFSSIGKAIRKSASFRNVVFSTISGPSIGYIPDEGDFENHGYASFLSPCIMGYPFYRRDVGQELCKAVETLWQKNHE